MTNISFAKLLLCCGLNISSHVSAGETPLITSGTTTTIWHKIPLVNTHLGPQGFIRVGKRLFSNVAGYPPYFVTVRGSNMIAFVTISESDNVLHIATPESGNVISVPGFKSSFGSWIGRVSLAPEEFDEAVILPNKRVLLRHSIVSSRRDVVVELTTGRVETTFDIPNTKPSNELPGLKASDYGNSTPKPGVQDPTRR